MGAFFSTIANAAHARADRMRQQAHDANSGQIEVYKGVLSNPNATPEQRQFAADSLNKLYAIKPDESPFHKVLGVLNHVGGKMQQPAAPAAPTTATPATAPASSPVAAPAPTTPSTTPDYDNLGPPKSLPSLDSFSSGGAGGATPSDASAAPSTNLTGSGSDTVHPSAGGRLKGIIGKGLSGLSTGLTALTSPLQPTGLAPIVPIEASQIPSPVLPGLKFDTQNLINGGDLQATDTDRFGNQVDPNKKYVAAPDPRGDVTIGGRRVSIQPFTPKPSMMAPRSLGTTMSLDDAKQLDTSGTPILNPSGKAYDLSKIPTNMKFQAVGLPGGGVGYVLGTEKQVKRTNGNENYIVNEFDQADSSKYVATGVARTPTSREQMVTDANTGETRAVPLTATPVTSGMPAGKSLPPVAPSGLPSISPAAQMDGKERTPTGQHTPLPGLPTPASAPAAHLTAPPVTQGASAGRVLSGVIPTGQAKGLRDRNTALNGTTTALENAIKPDETGKSYLDLFKPENTAERAKVANFIRLNDELAEGEYGARSSEGGVSSLLSFNLGIPAMVAAAKNDQLTKTYAELKKDPSAVRAVADYYNLIGMVGGMRKATGANASQWSFSNLKQEVPSPLLDSSYGGVLAKMHNLANEVNSNAQPNLAARPFDLNLLKTPSSSGAKVETKIYQGHTYQRPAGSSEAWHLSQ